MTAPERARRHLQELRARLREEYGQFRERTVHRDPSGAYEELLRRWDEHVVGAVGAWIRDDRGRVLLVHEREREGVESGWTDPGGALEPGESYEAGARREAREEAGVEIAITGVLEVIAVEHGPGDSGGESLVVPTVVFEADHVGGELRPSPPETDDVGWFESPPERVRYEAVRDRPY